ncbi:GRB2-associated-binding protein 3 isoform X5 [Cricetulus griseus]|uniref:GRB2-associated-binding protein 3 isoform X5 n=2 Tax=Cricetulus griseus TaxID=10029 RepID=A0A9J7GKQ5_CRIGR|nr:GRB2-associated-binding protein 3 isoform X5 [Cricetulus griseus]
MSMGDAVCTGWLVKSPPERKLQRYAWRKRWFVLRRGRMSGNPDVLEYYRNKHSSKPIRVIDLSECTVWKHAGPGFVRKEFQNNFVFIVKTTSRTFYLVAKTEEEMQVWVHSISQVCNLSHLEDGADSVESLSHMPSSLQPSPASSFHTAHVANSALPKDGPNSNTVATEETRSESEFLFLPDYLILSNCETGRLHHASLPNRCDSWSNSDRSLEQTSFDDVFLDGMRPFTANNLVHPLHHGNGLQDVPSTRPQAALIWTREINVPSRNHMPSSPFLESSLSPTIHVGKKQVSLPNEAKDLNIVSNTPPPRPPKPSYLSERRQEDQLLLTGYNSSKKPGYTMVPRRISLSGLDHVGSWKGDVQSQSLRNREKRLSLNLPCKFSPMYPTASLSAEDSSYVPMSPKGTTSLRPYYCQDDYIPMSSSMLPELPADLEPPPVNRDLKPQRKSRPPPLDLRNLSTIGEHTSLTRTHTVPCNRTSFLSPQRNGINSARFFATPSSEEESYIQMEEYRTDNSMSSSAVTWTKKFSLDYLALDFNSASPAPVQQKLLSEEQRVDYVQVDEQKTQALQSTKQEWTDERQSKVAGWGIGGLQPASWESRKPRTGEELSFP